jgi:hypothetical protein
LFRNRFPRPVAFAIVFMPPNSPTLPSTGRRHREDALVQGPRKKPYVYNPHTSLFFPIHIHFYSCLTDPLVSYGRHFNRTVHALSNIQVLITNGLLRAGELAGEPDEAFTAECLIFHPFHVLSLIPQPSVDKGVSIAYLQNCFGWFLGSGIV